MAGIVDDNDVIAYRPNLDYNKDVKIQLDGKYYQESNPVEYTQSVISFINTKPSDTLDIFNQALDKAKSYLSKIYDDFKASLDDFMSFDSFVKSLSEGNSDYVANYIKEHSNDVNSETGIEIFKYISDAVSEVSNIKAIYNKILYGDYDIEQSEALSRDEVYNKKFIEYENSKDYTSINYAALKVDTLFNKSVQGYANVMDSYIDNLYSVYNKEPYAESVSGDEKLGSVISTMFNNATYTNDGDNKKLATYTNRDILPSIIYSIVENRKDFLNMINVKSVLENTDFQNYDIINKNIEKINTTINDSIIDFNKAIISSSMYRDDILDSINEKDYLRNIYKSINGGT